MNDGAVNAGHKRQWIKFGQAAARAAVVFLGIVLGQAILYGPSLLGDKILLPLDLLAQPGFFIPPGPDTAGIVPHDPIRSDPVLMNEPGRQFIASEIHAGRWPMWAPYEYCGSPVIWPKYSPFWLLSSCSLSPMILAWTQMAVALAAGFGIYVFCRNALGVGFWPAALVAWCYPLTAFFIVWQGYCVQWSTVWLPWLLWAEDNAIRRRKWWTVPAVMAFTYLALVSGQLDVAGQVLLASGLYAIWCLIDRYWRRSSERRSPLWALGTVAAGWALGFMLAAPYLLPLLEYSGTGSRMMHRGEGTEERKPVGLPALPQIVLPNMYGSTQSSTVAFFPENQGNLPESSAAAYAGLLATLLAAPLAWCSRRHRSINVFWAILAVVALTWVLNLPGVAILRLPGLNMMSHNRFVFAATFAILAEAAIGLDVLWRRDARRQRWLLLPAAVTGLLFLWCLLRSVVPSGLVAGLEDLARNGKRSDWVATVEQARQVRSWFLETYKIAAILGGLATAGWLIVWFHPKVTRWSALVVGLLMFADLLWFARGRCEQCDPALYYPRIPVLEQLAAAPPGRVLGARCLPATLTETHHLRDVRGYDGVDPARYVNLLELAAATDTRGPEYSVTQWFIPKTGALRPLQLHPVLDMLNVRYLVARGSPPLAPIDRRNPDSPKKPLEADFAGDDYWAMINHRALPRVFVPEQVKTVVDDKRRLALLARNNLTKDDNDKYNGETFDPRKEAYVETPLSLPSRCSGSAAIVDETPTWIKASISMQTPGLVVLADRWDKGWKAYLNGQQLPILVANHALRGVQVPAGEATLEFRYEPGSFTLGLWLAALSLGICLLWSAAVAWTGNPQETPPPPEAWPKNHPAAIDPNKQHTSLKRKRRAGDKEKPT